MDEEFTTTAYPNVQENLKLPSADPVILEEPAGSTGTMSSLQNFEKELSFTNQFFVEKQWEEELGKTNTEAEVQSMVSVPIHQDTSSVPPMTTSVSKAVDEIVTDAVNWAMKAPLRAHFSDLPIVDIKEIIQQWMFEDKSYEAHKDHKNLYDTLEKSLERDYSYQLLSDLEEARQKKIKRRDLPRTPFGSPPPQPPPPPPLAGASYAPGTSGASGSSQSPLPPLHPSTALTTSDTRYKSVSVSKTQELSLTDSQIQDYSILDEHVYLSDDEESRNDHLPKADSRKYWWKPLPGKERLVTPEPAWTIPSSNTNLEGDQVKVDVNRPLPLGGPPGHVTIQIKFFFNKYLEYLRYSSKGSSLALSISKMKATSYPEFGLELLVPEQIHDSPSRQKEVRSHMRILSVVRIKAYSRYGADLQEHTIAEKDFKNLYPSDFEDLNLLLLQGHAFYCCQAMDPKLSDSTAVVFSVNNNKRRIMRFNEIYKFSDGTLTRILEALAYRVKEFKIKRLNQGMNTRFWTQKDVIRSKDFITAIERRLKMRRIYQNLECFVGGRVRDIDYRLL
nr:hypothetical protein [Tanacetum cinerariifolium]